MYFRIFSLLTLVAAGLLSRHATPSAIYVDDVDASDNLIPDNLIPDTCKKCAATDPNISYGFCLTTLQAAPEGPCADDLHKLGRISIELLQRNVTSTRCHINQLRKNKKLDPFVRACLDDCLELYSDATETLKQAAKDYKARRYVDANVKVSSVADAATTCEDGFKEKEGVVSPLKKRDNDTFLLSAVSLSIINMHPR